NIWLRRFVAVVTKTNLHTGVCSFAQGRHQLGAERITEPHVVNGKIESLLCRAYECGQPRHDGIGGLFALSEKENRKIIHAGSGHRLIDGTTQVRLIRGERLDARSGLAAL